MPPSRGLGGPALPLLPMLSSLAAHALVDFAAYAWPGGHGGIRRPACHHRYGRLDVRGPGIAGDAFPAGQSLRPRGG